MNIRTRIICVILSFIVGIWINEIWISVDNYSIKEIGSLTKKNNVSMIYDKCNNKAIIFRLENNSNKTIFVETVKKGFFSEVESEEQNLYCGYYKLYDKTGRCVFFGWCQTPIEYVAVLPKGSIKCAINLNDQYSSKACKTSVAYSTSYEIIEKQKQIHQLLDNDPKYFDNNFRYLSE